jgi:hypothetical protein
MTELLMLCVIWAWIPGANDTNYEFFGDDVLIGATTDTQIEACFPDYYTPVTYYVVGLNDFGDQSVPSNSITAQAVWNFDADQDGIVGWSDFSAFFYAFRKPPPQNGPNFDADGDGIVGFVDFDAFVNTYGQCNNGKRLVKCLPAQFE